MIKEDSHCQPAASTHMSSTPTHMQVFIYTTNMVYIIYNKLYTYIYERDRETDR